MNKLTQQEASDLIQKAWQDVSKHTLGSYRFGMVLWELLPADLKLLDNEDIELLYEPNSDIATEKFYKYFVEGSDEQL